MGDAVLDTRPGDLRRIGRVDLDADDPRVRDALRDRIGPLGVVVGHHPQVEERPPRGDRRRCRPNSSCTDHQYPHIYLLWTNVLRSCHGTGSHERPWCFTVIT